MAGDWLKFEVDTPEKQEVFSITVAMGWSDPDLTVGKLLKVWRWFDKHTINGNAQRVTTALLDGISGVSGFAQAMCDVGWLVRTEDGISLSNFDRHNGKTAKDRCLTAKRVAKHKTNASGNAKSNAASVNPALPREDKIIDKEEDQEQRPEQASAATIGGGDGAVAPESTEKRTRRRGSEEDEKCARWLYGQLLNVLPSAKEPNWNGWSDDVRLMREVDKRTHHEICELFLWATKDAFWCRNILSPSKLREKWDQLQVVRQMPAARPGTAAKPSAYQVAHIDHSETDRLMAEDMARRGTTMPADGNLEF